MADSMDGSDEMLLQVERDYTASDSAQLSVKEGELVYVKQKDQLMAQLHSMCL